MSKDYISALGLILSKSSDNYALDAPVKKMLTSYSNRPLNATAANEGWTPTSASASAGELSAVYFLTHSVQYVGMV